MTPDDLSERLLDFAVRIAKVVDALPKTKMGQHVAGQLARSGTSAPPNYEEACAAESKADFIHKVRIALKEMRETHFWLRCIVRAELLGPRLMSGIIDECRQLCDILGKSAATAAKNRRRKGGDCKLTKAK